MDGRKGLMDSLERAFDDTEEAAASALNAAKELEKIVKALQKAAKDGNIKAIRKTRSSLDGALGPLRQAVANATESWSFKDEEEEEYLRKHYADELLDVAAKTGLNIRERDGVLISYPSIVRILPGDRAVRIDKSKKTTLRPSRLAEILVEQQRKRSRFRPDAFLEALHNRYLVSAKTQSPTLPSSHGSVVPLAKIYEAFTSLPGSNREYSKIDFARDIYLLEDRGVLATKSGARASFPSSTGAKSAKDTFPFVNPDGQIITYYGIQFSGGK